MSDTMTCCPQSRAVSMLLLLVPAVTVAASGTRCGGSCAREQGRVIIIVPACPGDCDGDDAVTINELITGVNIALGQTRVEACFALDLNADGEVTVEEIISALNRSLFGCAVEPSSLSLSAAALTPGEMLTIFHPSITAGRAVTVTFRGPDQYLLTVSTNLTDDGAARVAVPPFIETTSFRFTSGQVAVSIGGVDSEQTLFITTLPEVQATPGELTVALLDFAIDNLAAALDGLDELQAHTGVDQIRLAAVLEERGDVLATMADEIEEFGELTLGTPTGSVVLRTEQLALLDRLVAATVSGAVAQAGGAAARGGGGAACDARTYEGIADCLEPVKRQIIPGLQVVGSFVSVTLGAAALAAGGVTATAAAAYAVAGTLFVTTISFGASVVADLSIDALRNQDPDLYRSMVRAEDIVIGGFRSIAFTVAGAYTWAGSNLASWLGFANDSRDGVINIRDLTCTTNQERRLSMARDSKQNFCRLTQDSGVPSPTPLPTATRPPATATLAPTPLKTPTATVTRPVATATRTLLPSTTPSRTATRTATSPASTATPTATRSLSPTPTRTSVQSTFTVSFYQNTDGATGTSAAGAQVQVSGAADFPTISWAASVGDVLQVTVVTNPGGLLYGINAAGKDGEPVPIRSSVRYGDYAIPNAVRLVEFAAPPLVARTEYAVNVTPINFQGRSASIVFTVR